MSEKEKQFIYVDLNGLEFIYDEESEPNPKQGFVSVTTESEFKRLKLLGLDFIDGIKVFLWTDDRNPVTGEDDPLVYEGVLEFNQKRQQWGYRINQDEIKPLSKNPKFAGYTAKDVVHDGYERTKEEIPPPALRPPATESEISSKENQLGVRFPVGYVEFLSQTNGAECYTKENTFARLWSLSELLEKNQTYEVTKHAPGLLLFGSDGGGKAYGFDTRAPEWPIVEVPFVGIRWDVSRRAGDTFEDFLKTVAPLVNE